MARIPIAQRLTDIEGQANRLKRRIGVLTADRDFLTETMISRPWQDMAAQRRLLEEWNEEIGKLEADLDFLRKEWSRLNEYGKRNNRRDARPCVSTIINFKL